MSPADPQPARPKPREHWAVCTVFSKRAGRIQVELGEMGFVTLVPTYGRLRYQDGKESGTQRQLMPGYLFVKLLPDDCSRISDLEGVYRFLPAGERASERLRAEVEPLRWQDANRVWDEIERKPEPPKPAARRSRPSKRVRKRLRAARMGVAA